MKRILYSAILIFAMFLASCIPADITEPVDSDLVPVSDDDLSKPVQITEEEETEEPIEQETRELGGTFEEWKEIIEENVPGSAAEQAFLDCDVEMSKLVETCSQYGGWMVDNIMEVKDLQTGEVYEYSDLAKGGCDQTDRTKIDSQLIDSQTEGEYQVICSINCYSWKCPVKKNWKVTIKGIGEYEPEFGISYQYNDEIDFIISKDGTIKESSSTNVDVTVNDQVLQCTGQSTFKIGYSISGDGSNGKVSLKLSDSSPSKLSMPLNCAFGEGTSEVLAPFEFGNERISLDLVNGATAQKTIKVSGEHNVDFHYTFTIIG